MRPGGVNSVKSQKYNLLVVRSSPAANILDVLVLMYKIFCKIALKILKTTEKVHEKNDPPC